MKTEGFVTIIFNFSCKKTPWLLKWVKLIEKLVEDPTNSTKIMSIGTIDSITSLLDEEEPPPPDTLWYLTKTPIKYSLLTVRYFLLFFLLYFCGVCILKSHVFISTNNFCFPLIFTLTLKITNRYCFSSTQQN